MTDAALRSSYREHLRSVIAALALELDAESQPEDRTGCDTERAWQDCECLIDRLRRRAYAVADARIAKEVEDAEAKRLVRRPGA